MINKTLYFTKDLTYSLQLPSVMISINVVELLFCRMVSSLQRQTAGLLVQRAAV